MFRSSEDKLSSNNLLIFESAFYPMPEYGQCVGFKPWILSQPERAAPARVREGKVSRANLYEVAHALCHRAVGGVFEIARLRILAHKNR